MKFRSSVLLVAEILIGLGVHDLRAQTPQFLWAKRVASTVNPDGELAIGMAMDSATNLYVTGWFDGTNDFGGVILTNKSGGGQDIFVGKYNSNGALQWTRRAGGSSANRDAGRGVGVDTNGNVYATGGFYSTADFGSINVTSASAQSFFLTKYDSNGVAQWVRQSINGGSVGTGSYGMALAVDASGNNYAAGCFSGVTTITLGTTTLTNAGSYNIFLVKYDNTGGFQWAKSFNSPGWSYANTVTLDSNGNVYVTGTFNPSVGIGATNFTSAGGKDGFVAQFNSAGTLQWARQMAGNSDDTAQATSVDGAGNVYVCGGFGNTAGDTVSFGPGITLTNIGGGKPGAGIGDAFLAKYNSAGAPQWARRAGGTQMDVYSGVSADAYGNIYVTGGAGSALIPGAFNVVIAKYDSNGVVQLPPDATSTFALPWAGPMVDAGGNCYLAGWFQTNAVFGTNTITGPGYFDYFLAKLAPGAPVSSHAPVVTTGIGTAITPTSATLNGTVNPNGVTTTAQFEYGVTAAYGSAISVALSPSDGSTAQAVSTTLNSLQSGKSYHFRLTATNSDGAGIGSDATFTIPPYAYTTNSGTITITAYTGSGGTVTIPSTINGLLVTTIGSNAFYGCSNLTSVSIPSSVTNIGSYAFEYCPNLTAVYFSGNAPSSLGLGVFYGDDNATVYYLSGTTGWSSSLAGRPAMLLPYTYTTNSGTITITKYTGSNGVVTIPDTINGLPVTSIGSAAFWSCYSLTNVTIPDSVTSIRDHAFNGCIRLASVTIGANVSSIDYGVFYGCTSLTSITIPASVTSIGGEAFSYCNSLSAITVSTNNPVYSDVAGVLFNKSQTMLIKCPGGKAGNYTVPTSVTSLGDLAFYACGSLTGVFFQSDAPSLGSSVFAGADNATVYRLEGFTGWGTAFGGRLVGLWTPQVPCSYTTNSGTASITKYIGSGGAVTVPDTINGLPVTSIGTNAFGSCTSLTSVTIGTNVTAIGDYAFYSCASLTSITIPNGVTNIGGYAFRYCTSLTIVTLGTSVAGIGDYTFANCYGLTSATIPKSVITIGSSAFSGCDNLASVSIGTNVTSIGSSTFAHCPLTSVIIPDSVTSIGSSAFSSCIFLTSITIPNKVTSIGAYTFYNCSSLTSVAIGNSVTNIGDYAFSGCTSLTSVTLTNGVTSIGAYTFHDCYQLTAITIPSSVTSIGYIAFDWCTSLKQIIFQGNAPSLVSDYLGTGAIVYILPGTTGWGSTFGYCPIGLWDPSVPCTYTTNSGTANITRYIGAGGAVTIPNRLNGLTVTSIGDSAFDNSGSLTSVIFPDSVTNLGNYTFQYCTNLANITIPTNVTSIGGSTFAGCTGLTNIAMPASVTNIGDYAFSGCSGLISIAIPTNLTYIGNDAFSGCSSLTTVTIPSHVASIGNYAFYYCTSLTEITIPNSITSIGVCVFYCCTSLTSVTIPSHVASIGGAAFYGCTNLTSITIPNSVISIGDNSFSGSGLTNITIPDSVTNIGSSAFSTCYGLTSITVDTNNPVYSTRAGVLFNRSQTRLIQYPGGGAGSYMMPNSVTDIGYRAFLYCTSLTNITIPNSVTSIGDYAFSSCTGLTSITIPNSVTNIGWGAFGYCTSLTSITIPESVTSIAGSAFSGCTHLASVTIPNSVTNIGSAAFYQCTALTSVTIPRHVSSMGNQAFHDCYSLTRVYFQGNAPSVGYEVFSYSTPATVYYVEGTKGWYTPFGGRPAVMLAAPTLRNIGRLQFGLSGTAEIHCDIEKSTNLVNWSFLGRALAGAVLDLGQLDPAWRTSSRGFFRATLASSQQNLPPTITAQPVGASAATGESASFVVAASGSLPLQYQWLLNGTNLAGATNASIVFTNLQPSQAGLYSVVITNVADAVTSVGAPLTVSSRIPMGEDFNSPTKDTSKWGPDIIASPGGQLEQTNGHLQFLGQGSIARPWIGSYGSYTQNWELILDVNLGNVALPLDNSQIRVGLGLASSDGPLMPDGSPANRLGLGLGLGRAAGLSYRAFGADIYTNGAVASQSFALTTNQYGSVRVSFDAVTKTLTSWYDASGDTGVHHWTALKVQQINLPPANWGMTDNSTFLLALTADCNGYTLNSSDQVYVDNCLIYGSVPVVPPYTWTTNSGTITITRYTGPGGAVIIPSMITGLPVTSISEDAFSECASLTSVTIPSGVTNTGDYAFVGCSSLTTIAVDPLNALYSSVDGVLFKNSTNTLIRCPEGKSGSYTIPNSVTSIAFAALYQCAHLTSVTIPSSVTNIEMYAFDSCTGLSWIAVNSLSSYYSSVNGVLFNRSTNTLIKYPGAKGGSYLIPNSVTNIAVYAFELCTGLTALTIPNSVNSIEEGAFYGCSGLTSLMVPVGVTNIGDGAFGACTSLTNLTLPASVISIGEGAFTGCSSLTAIAVDTNNPGYTSVDGVLFNKSKTTLVAYPGAKVGIYTLPISATSIGPRAFFGCGSLSSVTIPNAVTNIGNWAFVDCSSLTGVYFQGNAPTLGWSVFYGANKATLYYLPGTTGWGTTFGDRPTALWALPYPLILNNEPSFGVQTNRFSFIISWATNIPVVVEACTNLATHIWSPVATNTLTGGSSYFSDPQWTNYPARFYRLRSQLTLPSPYKYTTNNGTITITGYAGPGGAVSIPSEITGLAVTCIGGNAFYSCTNLTSVIIPTSITNISSWAFAHCFSLTNATIPSSVSSIGDGPFELCSSLSAITVVTNNSFYSSSADGILFNKSQTTLVQYPAGKAGSYTIPKSVTTLGFRALAYCTSLTAISVAAENSVYSSVDGVLFNITQTKLIQCPGSKAGSYTIPPSVTSLEDWAFYGCTSLTGITIPGTITNLGGGAFASCFSLSRVTIPSSIASLNDWAFESCYSLTTITISSSVTSIGDHAFEYCPSLTGVYFQGNAPSFLGSGVFFNDENATVYYLPWTTGWDTEFSGRPTALWSMGDDFNGPTKDTSKWGPDIIASPGGELVQTNGQLQFLGQGSVARPWVGSYGSYTEDWELILDINLGNVSLAQDNVLVKVGLWLANSNGPVLPEGTPANRLGLGMGLKRSSGENYRAFASGIDTNGVSARLSVALTTNQHASVRVTFDAATKSLTSWYDASGDTSAHHWTALSVNQINVPPTDWGMTDSSAFRFALAASCDGYIVNATDQVYSDNLLIYGSVPLSVPYTWTTNNGTITITGYTGPGGAVTIPGMITGRPVTIIGDSAFQGSTNLAGVTLPNCITNIESYAFQDCTNLASVTIPEGVSHIGDGAFEWCYGLTNVTIPASVTSLGDGGVNGDGAFLGCTNLLLITVDTNNLAFASVDGVLFNKSQTTLVQYPGGKAGSYTVPNNITSIRFGAFVGCTRLLLIMVDTNNISYSSVAGVLFNRSKTALVAYPGGRVGSYTVPASVSSIENGAFAFCPGLTSVSIPATVTSIRYATFALCASLSSVTIPNSVTNIGIYAFSACSSLTNVSIPNSVTDIGESAFQECASLASVTIGSGVTSLGHNVFERCPSLTSITIPASVTSLGIDAFHKCTSLTAVYFQGTAPSVDSSAFNEDNNATVYYLPGTTGWNTTFGDRPTALWLLPTPLILNNGPSFGVQSNGFSFIISWATNIPVVVEACTNLANHTWSPVGTNTLTGGWSYFSDPQWTNYPARLYRLRSP